MLFEIHGLILALHHDARFLRLPGALERVQRAFDHVLAHYTTDASTVVRPRPRRTTASNRPHRSSRER